MALYTSILFYELEKIIGACIGINFRALECGTNIKLKGEHFLGRDAPTARDRTNWEDTWSQS